MIYKYKKIVTQGSIGTSLSHKSTDDNPIDTLGEIDGFTYISCDSLTEQHPELDFIAVVLSDAESEELHKQKYLQVKKANARNEIRKIKDFEDDLTDLKKVVQFMARGFAGLWASLPQDMKDANPYKDNFDLFTQAVATTQMRLDLESDQVSKIAKILEDEAEFAQIVNTEYLSKME